MHIAKSNYASSGRCFLEVLVRDDVHKYPGKILTRDVRNRGRLEIAHRRKVCWSKFHKHAHLLLNKHVPLQLRLKFAEVFITPRFCVVWLPRPLQRSTR